MAGTYHLVVAALFGIYLLISGFMALILGFSAPMPTLARVLTVLSGALSVLVGVLCFRNPLQSVLWLSVFIAIGWVFRGVGQIAEGFGRFKEGGGWAVFSGLVSLLGGLFLLAYPISSLVTLVWVSGIFLVIGGVTQIVHALQFRKVLQAMAPTG